MDHVRSSTATYVWPFVFHLQLAIREVEHGAILSPQENGVFDFALAEPEIQERLSQAAEGGLFSPHIHRASLSGHKTPCLGEETHL